MEQNFKQIAVKYCRTCYDHLAGQIGVAIADSMLKKKLLLADFTLSPRGEKWCREFGIDLASLKTQRRTFIRSCMDQSEQKPHIAGALGAALLEKMLSEDWLRRSQHSRAIMITGKGENQLEEWFGIGK